MCELPVKNPVTLHRIGGRYAALNRAQRLIGLVFDHAKKIWDRKYPPLTLPVDFVKRKIGFLLRRGSVNEAHIKAILIEAHEYTIFNSNLYGSESVCPVKKIERNAAKQKSRSVKKKKCRIQQKETGSCVNPSHSSDLIEKSHGLSEKAKCLPEKKRAGTSSSSSRVLLQCTAECALPATPHTHRKRNLSNSTKRSTEELSNVKTFTCSTLQPLLPSSQPVLPGETRCEPIPQRLSGQLKDSMQPRCHHIRCGLVSSSGWAQKVQEDVAAYRENVRRLRQARFERMLRQRAALDEQIEERKAYQQACLEEEERFYEEEKQQIESWMHRKEEAQRSEWKRRVEAQKARLQQRQAQEDRVALEKKRELEEAKMYLKKLEEQRERDHEQAQKKKLTLQHEMRTQQALNEAQRRAKEELKQQEFEREREWCDAYQDRLTRRCEEQLQPQQQPPRRFPYRTCSASIRNDISSGGGGIQALNSHCVESLRKRGNNTPFHPVPPLPPHKYVQKHRCLDQPPRLSSACETSNALGRAPFYSRPREGEYRRGVQTGAEVETEATALLHLQKELEEEKRREREERRCRQQALSMELEQQIREKDVERSKEREEVMRDRAMVEKEANEAQIARIEQKKAQRRRETHHKRVLREQMQECRSLHLV